MSKKPSTKPKTVKPVKQAECVFCHKLKPIQARGSCAACYQRQYRRGLTAVDKLTAQAETLENMAQKARDILQEALPDAARYMKQAAKKAAAKGDHRGAQAILELTPTELADGSTRVIAAAPRSEAAQSMMPTINILIPGGQLGCAKPKEPELPAVDVEVVQLPDPIQIEK